MPHATTGEFRDHKFKHLFQDVIPLCTCSLEAETTNHFILHCPYYENKRDILFASIRKIKSSILDQNDNNIVKTLYELYSLRETQHKHFKCYDGILDIV